MLVSTAFAGGDTKEAAKSKRAYSLGYGYSPYTSYFDHDLIDHAPIAAVHHAPVATTVHHAPIAPIVAAPVSPIVSAPVARVTSSVVSTNVHHYPAPFVAPPSRYISASPYFGAYHAPAALVAPAYASSPYVHPALLTAAYHRR